MKHCFKLASVLLLTAGVTAMADDGPTVPEGVHYKTATAEVNAKATEVIKAFLVAGSTDDQAAAFFNTDLLICGPAAWHELKKDPQLADTGVATTIMMPVDATADAPAHDQKLDARTFKSRADIVKFWHAFVGKYNLDGIKVRKLTTDELKLYWGMVSFDVTEPVLIAECGERKFLFQFKSPDDLRVMWFDDMSTYRQK
jgi:hypothetical protein